MGRIFRYLKYENGASAAEYALILAIVGAAIAFAFFFLGQAIGVAADRAANCLSGASAGSCS